MHNDHTQEPADAQQRTVSEPPAGHAGAEHATAHHQHGQSHEHGHDHEEHRDHQLVTVTVDGQPKQVRKGEYLVSQFKQLVGVDPSRALDEVVDGVFKALDESAHIKIKGGELFVSHVRTGSSS